MLRLPKDNKMLALPKDNKMLALPKDNTMLALPKDNTMLAPPKDNKMLNRSRVTSCHFEEPEEPCNTLSEWKTLKTLKR